MLNGRNCARKVCKRLLPYWEWANRRLHVSSLPCQPILTHFFLHILATYSMLGRHMRRPRDADSAQNAAEIKNSAKLCQYGVFCTFCRILRPLASLSFPLSSNTCLYTMGVFNDSVMDQNLCFCGCKSCNNAELPNVCSKICRIPSPHLAGAINPGVPGD